MMQQRYEKWLLAGYLLRLTARIDRESRAARALVAWLGENENLVVAAPKQRKKSRGLGACEWEAFCLSLKTLAEPEEVPKPDLLDGNVAALAAAFDLDEVDRRILSFFCRIAINRPLHGLCFSLVGTQEMDSVELLAALLGLERVQAWRRLRRGELIHSGMVRQVRNHAGHFQFAVNDEAYNALLPPNEGLGDIEKTLIGKPMAAVLTGEDFGHLQDDWDFLADLMVGAVRAKAAGVNVLLYGPPGTGKTEFCKALAAHLGLFLHAVGECDEDGDEPTRWERLNSLRLAQRVAARRRHTVLLFDEMEDFLDGGWRRTYEGRAYLRTGSKVFMNRLLEENPVPVFWICNSIELFDPALLRRFSYVLETKVPTARTRATLWSRICAREGMPLSAEEAKSLATDCRQAPGAVTGAIRAARLAGGGPGRLTQAASMVDRALGFGKRRAPAAASAAQYEPRLIQADCDLASLTQRLARPEAARDFSLCLYGPPGTGKSAYVRHLADEMGLTVDHRRASDLLSMWLGQSEKNIAEAFAQAREEGAFLIIDEADSLLMDRGGALRSWEVSQVNEMLTWMECHPVPFACTTNLMESLDRAALRRFTFKVKFDFLSAEQVGLAFETFYRQPAPRELRRLANLTPGDFAVVARRLRYLDAGAKAQLIVDLLEQECRLKPGQAQPIGFVAG